MVVVVFVVVVVVFPYHTKSNKRIGSVFAQIKKFKIEFCLHQREKKHFFQVFSVLPSVEAMKQNLRNYFHKYKLKHHNKVQWKGLFKIEGSKKCFFFFCEKSRFRSKQDKICGHNQVGNNDPYEHWKDVCLKTNATSQSYKRNFVLKRLF